MLVAVTDDRDTGYARDEARRREALKTLGELRGGDSVVGSSLVRAARRASAHFAGRDAGETGDARDPIELWGRRIGRALSLAAFVALAIYLYATYWH